MDDLLEEVEFVTSRSGGKGGQHINKVETKVSLYFNIEASKYLSTAEKELLVARLSNKVNKQGLLYLSCSTSRTQLGNKKTVQNRFLELIRASLEIKKERKKKKLSKAVKEKRLEKKRMQSEKKQNRSKPTL